MCAKKRNMNSCKICDSPNAIFQFGAISCRPCGAFFRRVVIGKKRYSCDCEVRMRGRVESALARRQRFLNCRGCRLRKCLEAGMYEEAVRECKKCLKYGTQCVKGGICGGEAEENALGSDYIKNLLEIEEKASRIYVNILGFGKAILDEFATLEQFLQSNDNLLAHSDRYKIRQVEYFDKAAFEADLSKYGLWHREPISLIKHLLIAVNIAKLLPAFPRLDLNDQVAAVHGFVLTACNFIGRFHSMRINVGADVLENNNYPLFELYTKSTNCEEPIIKNLAEAVFDQSMKNFLQVSPSKEEFILLLTLLFTNAAIPALSKPGQHVMNEETEKCAKTLLRLQQRQFGEQGGALRYAECLQLLWNTISTARKHQELIVYIDTVYEQGRFEAVMPRILAPLVIGRKNAVEI